MKSIVIRLIQTHTGEAPELNGMYVKHYDPDGVFADGTMLAVTDKPEEAKQFSGKGEALEYYNQVSKKEPVRADGKPNRPLTAFMCCFGTVEQCKDTPIPGSM